MTISPAVGFTVMQTLTRVSHAIDRGDSTGVADCFTATGEIVVGGLDVEVDHAGTTAGRDAIIQMADGVFELTQGHCRHWNGPPVLEGTDSGVRATHYLQVVRAGQTPSTGIIATGIYIDELVPSTDEWLIARREVRMDRQQDHAPLLSTDPLILRFDAFIARASGQPGQADQ